MLEAYLKDLEEVVNIDCGSATVEGVTKVAEIMKRHYDELGFATELVDLGPKAGKGLRASGLLRRHDERPPRHGLPRRHRC